MASTTTRLGLVVYATSDKFRITDQTNSFNANMQILDAKIVPVDMTWGDAEDLLAAEEAEEEES